MTINGIFTIYSQNYDIFYHLQKKLRKSFKNSFFWKDDARRFSHNTAIGNAELNPQRDGAAATTEGDDKVAAGRQFRHSAQILFEWVF